MPWLVHGQFPRYEGGSPISWSLAPWTGWGSGLSRHLSELTTTRNTSVTSNVAVSEAAPRRSTSSFPSRRADHCAGPTWHSAGGRLVSADLSSSQKSHAIKKQWRAGASSNSSTANKTSGCDQAQHLARPSIGPWPGAHGCEYDYPAQTLPLDPSAVVRLFGHGPQGIGTAEGEEARNVRGAQEPV